MKFLLQTTTFITSLSTAIAGGCGILMWPPTPCGEVTNLSQHQLKFTMKLADDRSGPHFCDVWNHDGGNTPKWQQVSCDQQPLNQDEHYGGGTKDVDAFTFADQPYRVAIRGTDWNNQEKGVWTKIGSDELATCWDDIYLGGISCTVEWDI